MRHATMRNAKTIALILLLPLLVGSTDPPVSPPPFPNTQEGLHQYLGQLEAVIESQISEFQSLLAPMDFETLNADHSRWEVSLRQACASRRQTEEENLSELRCLVSKSEAYFHERETQLMEIVPNPAQSSSP